eukprot:jgi/Chrzof1/10828/Cz05g13190.t1
MAGTGGNISIPVTADELEFFAEEELITIVPTFAAQAEDNKFACIPGSYGPFYPNIPTEVPIWLAVQLCKRSKCRILPPTWLSLNNLDHVISLEQNDSSVFQPVPFYYMEIACLLFKEQIRTCFGEDFFWVRDKLQRLSNIRRHKIEDGLKEVSQAATVKLNNLSAYEANMIRLSFQGTLNMFLKLEEAENQYGPSMTINNSMSGY